MKGRSKLSGYLEMNECKSNVLYNKGSDQKERGAQVIIVYKKRLYKRRLVAGLQLVLTRPIPNKQHLAPDRLRHNHRCLTTYQTLENYITVLFKWLQNSASSRLCNSRPSLHSIDEPLTNVKPVWFLPFWITMACPGSKKGSSALAGKRFSVFLLRASQLSGECINLHFS